MRIEQHIELIRKFGWVEWMEKLSPGDIVHKRSNDLEKTEDIIIRTDGKNYFLCYLSVIGKVHGCEISTEILHCYFAQRYIAFYNLPLTAFVGSHADVLKIEDVAIKAVEDILEDLSPESRVAVLNDQKFCLDCGVDCSERQCYCGEDG